MGNAFGHFYEDKTSHNAKKRPKGINLVNYVVGVVPRESNIEDYKNYEVYNEHPHQRLHVVSQEIDVLNNPHGFPLLTDVLPGFLGLPQTLGA